MKIIKTARWFDEEHPDDRRSNRLKELYIQRRQIETEITELETHLGLVPTSGDYSR